MSVSPSLIPSRSSQLSNAAVRVPFGKTKTPLLPFGSRGDMRGTTLHYTQAHIRNVDRRLHLLRSKKELTGDINQWNVPACTIRRLSMPWTTECFVPIIAFQVPVTQAASETTFFISETPG